MRLLGHRTFPVGNHEALADAILELTYGQHVVNRRATDLVDRLFGPSEIAAQYVRLASHTARRAVP